MGERGSLDNTDGMPETLEQQGPCMTLGSRHVHFLHDPIVFLLQSLLFFKSCRTECLHLEHDYFLGLSILGRAVFLRKLPG